MSNQVFLRVASALLPRGQPWLVCYSSEAPNLEDREVSLLFLYLLLIG